MAPEPCFADHPAETRTLDQGGSRTAVVAGRAGCRESWSRLRSCLSPRRAGVRWPDCESPVCAVVAAMRPDDGSVDHRMRHVRLRRRAGSWHRAHPGLTSSTVQSVFVITMPVGTAVLQASFTQGTGRQHRLHIIYCGRTHHFVHCLFMNLHSRRLVFQVCAVSKIPHFPTGHKLVGIGTIGLQLVTAQCKLNIVQSGGGVGPSRLSNSKLPMTPWSFSAYYASQRRSAGAGIMVQIGYTNGPGDAARLGRARQEGTTT